MPPRDSATPLEISIEAADKQLAGFLAEGADRFSSYTFIGDNVGGITADQLAEGQVPWLQLFCARLLMVWSMPWIWQRMFKRVDTWPQGVAPWAPSR